MLTRPRGVGTPVRACCALSVLSGALLGCVSCAPAAGRGAVPGPQPVYVRGAGRIADDWSDEERLSTARHGRTDLVARTDGKCAVADAKIGKKRYARSVSCTKNKWSSYHDTGWHKGDGHEYLYLR